MTRIADFDFNVPPELVAQEPAAQRDHSRLMVVNRKTGELEHRSFHEIVDYFQPGDLLVLNDTKVLPANLIGRKEESGAKVEVLLVRRIDVAATFRSPINGSLKTAATFDPNIRQIWECLVKPGKRLKVGSRVIFGDNEIVGSVLEKTETGEQIINFEGDLDKYMHQAGELPLPPYIKKVENRKSSAESRYQTVYAEKEGASAAPTAGLHFTPELLDKIRTKGVKIATITLHTGLATFKPIYTEQIEDHKMHTEYFEITKETIEAVRAAERVIAVGTTSVRALETVFNSLPLSPTHPLTPSLRKRGGIKDVIIKGETDLFITPGYEFKVVDAMVTNFHWPRTTLILLVSAFAGKDFILKAYQTAVNEKYRFFSFGDAMLIL
ncbi:MAG: tRNA preQ1(34) S-adenosylmethionine ribosyltransferase-isomerase QueA [Candidatus Margulisiibacteriota bacterium]